MGMVNNNCMTTSTYVYVYSGVYVLDIILDNDTWIWYNTNMKDKQRQADNMRRGHYRRKYGQTIADYDLMYAMQDGCCAGVYCPIVGSDRPPGTRTPGNPISGCDMHRP